MTRYLAIAGCHVCNVYDKPINLHICRYCSKPVCKDCSAQVESQMKTRVCAECVKQIAAKSE